MEYLKGKAFLGDFAKRTLRNLEIIEQKEDSYEVTQLINSLLGLIVFPKERQHNEHYSPNWISILQNYVVHPSKNLNDNQILRNLRNSIGHSHILFEKDTYLDEYGKGKIKSITFISCDYVNDKPKCPKNTECENCKLRKNGQNAPDFELTIPVTELRNCIELITNELINTTTNIGGGKGELQK